jgi:outer membrane lipoprotein-sorting protein
MNMNHEHESEFERRLRHLPADDAVRPEHQERVRAEALAAFDHAVATRRVLWRRVLIIGRDVMKRPIPRMVATACVVAALAWLLWPGSNTAAASFEQMVDAVVSARSARFRMEVKVEGQAKQVAKVLFQAPAKYRMEMEKDNVVNISDFQAAKMLSLIPGQKTAVVFNLKNVPKDAGKEPGKDAKGPAASNYFEQLRQLLGDRANLPAHERLGEKMIDGRKAVGFRIDSGIGSTTLWGDPKTGHPVRIENVYSGVPTTQTVMTEFDINVEVDPALLALDIPAGYKVQAFDIDASPARESDLVESLRVCAELSGGTFPDALDTQSVMKLMIGTILNGKKGDKAAAVDSQKLYHESMAIGRGFQFALGLPGSAKAHYAGKGVKRGTKARPIFWYRPEGGEGYRVLDADLTVRDTQEPPQIEGAVPLVRKAGGQSK